MTGLDRYLTFGTRAEWMDIFFRYDCGADFWVSDGDGLVANKKKDAFEKFVLDAGLVVYDKNVDGDKYTRYVPTATAETVCRIGAFEESTWALIRVILFIPQPITGLLII